MREDWGGLKGDGGTICIETATDPLAPLAGGLRFGVWVSREHLEAIYSPETSG